MKKVISLLLASFMIVALFVGCGNNDKTDANADNSDSQKATENGGDKDQKTDNAVEEVDVEFSYPIEGNKSLTYWLELTGNVAQTVSNFGDTPFAEELQQETGVNVEFLHPPAGQTNEAFSILAASGDYPDLIEYNFITNYPGGPEKAMMDSLIIDLTEYMSDYAPNLLSVYEQYPEFELMAKTDTHKHYSFPFIREDKLNCLFFGPIVRKDWLEDLGLEEPETIDEWYNMLIAFKNEKGAVAPFTTRDALIHQMTKGSAFMGAYGITDGFYLADDGEVKFGPIEKGYKEFITEFSKWYKEGLIDPDILTVDGRQVSTKMTNGDSGATIGFGGGNLGTWMSTMEDDPTYEIGGVKFPVLEKGQIPKFSHEDFSISGNASVSITTGCKDIETAMRFLDYAYGEEGNMLYCFGIEGESYNIVDGQPVISDKMKNDPELALSYMLSRYTRGNGAGPFLQTKECVLANYGNDVQVAAKKDYWAIGHGNEFNIPPVTPNQEESQELSTIMNEVNTYKQEMYAAFLLGEEDIDDTWDEYVGNIKAMNIDRAIEIETIALERYKNR